MANQTTQITCSAFEAGRSIGYSNTTVVNENGTMKMFLFGNKIAEYVNGKLHISMCGWGSRTTQERLNGLTGVSLTRKNWEWYLNGQPISTYATYEVVAGQPIREV